MKITPIAAGGNTNNSGIEVGRNPERVKLAKAIAAGEPAPQKTVEEERDERLERINARRIKMKTQVSPERYAQEPVQEEEKPVADSSTSDNAVEAQATIEETKPLSPQFAALAKQRRALQVKERELLDKEKALEARSTTDGNQDFIAKLKSQPLSVLQEQGVLTPEFYNSMTEHLLGNQPNPEIQALKEELRSLKEGVDKTFTERDTTAEKQVLAEMRRDAEAIIKDGDQFELVRGEKKVQTAIDLIHRTWKESGEILDVTDALGLVEAELEKDAQRVAQYKKIQGRMQDPAQGGAPQQQQTSKPAMRTLTNRDNASVLMDRKARAYAAFNGTLKR